MNINPFQDMKAVIFIIIINDYLSHAQLKKIKKIQWVLAGLPSSARSRGGAGH